MQIIADNIQITNPVIARALSEMDPLPIQDLAKKCEAAGADIIDINPGPLTRDGEEKMTFLVDAIQQVSGLPLSLDTSNPSAMAAGLKACRKKPVINGFSLEPAKLKKILPLAREFDCHIIGFLLYSNGMVPGNAEERLNLAVQLFEAFNEKGIEPGRLIIDPVLAPVMWEDGSRQAMELLTVIRMLPDLLGFPVKTIVGLSNLTSGKGPKEKKLFLEEVYLSMLASAGLDKVLMNIFHQNTVSVARACDAITRQGIFSWEEVP
ncbi:MAG: dihydropteroate synthase [Deltaproteobacteria bacterium]|nr:dihydropteroate synthase [Deltaproteobacteria bacterium]